ncbi:MULTISPECIES: hypothetical protein [Bacillus amyloliquefaciens group]|uniref:hypothetical protein n=1 Tax=Bacillus amyloliquefaciens group TaxID=1938374 RepID=UPI00059B5E7B|nr:MULTISPECIES: hypothetical protein [Bacillus amyloliquefaciens group]KAF1274305.1 hypothetical protein BUE72_17285 [Bacillus amyloliquefaciens]MCM3278211.1 hypothetical protein [Bacillus velezensis]MCM3351331.1 hypothetical protein [Bacillus velezensis]MCO6398320.1 hypothetical protein [Bacillus velezensis]PQB09786.1 hypothetical protein C5O26_19830 [Bacillus velezensis]
MRDITSEFTLRGVNRKTLKLLATKSIDYPDTWVKVQIGDQMAEVEAKQLLVAINAFNEM